MERPVTVMQKSYGRCYFMKRAAAVIVLAALLCAVCCAQAAGDITVYWEGKPVTVKTPGSYQSVIRVDGHERTVLSSELTWDSSTDLRFGYIYAPNLGKVNMRMGPRSKATIVLKAETNRVVMIFDRQKEWTGVIYDGKAGYVMNGTLKADTTLKNATSGQDERFSHIYIARGKK